MEKNLRPDEAVLVSWRACRYQCSSQVEGIESLKKSEVQRYLVTSRHSSDGLKHNRFYRSKGLCREMGRIRDWKTHWIPFSHKLIFIH